MQWTCSSTIPHIAKAATVGIVNTLPWQADTASQRARDVYIALLNLVMNVPFIDCKVAYDDRQECRAHMS